MKNNRELIYQDNAMFKDLEAYSKLISDEKAKGILPNWKNKNVSSGCCDNTLQMSVRYQQSNAKPFFVNWTCEGINHYQFFRFPREVEEYKKLIKLNIIHGINYIFSPFVENSDLVQITENRYTDKNGVLRYAFIYNFKFWALKQDFK